MKMAAMSGRRAAGGSGAGTLEARQWVDSLARESPIPFKVRVWGQRRVGSVNKPKRIWHSELWFRHLVNILELRDAPAVKEQGATSAILAKRFLCPGAVRC